MLRVLRKQCRQSVAHLNELVAHAQTRWRIERDYQELTDEIGLDHYEGRSWPGFQHHAALCIGMYGFLPAERGCPVAL